MSTLIQRSFSGGEIAPSLYARVDYAKYATGLKTCKNFYVMRHGGVANRPGTQFIGEVKDSTKSVRLIPFIFNSDQTYVLEFGNLYMRVIRNGAYQTLTAQNITGITNANPAVLTYSGADTYANGDEVTISGVVGNIAKYVNGRNFKVANVNTGTNTFELNYLNGTAVNSTSWGTYTSGGTIAEVYTLTTTYTEAELFDIQYVQSADVVTLVHPDHAPAELTRSGHTSWALADISFAPDIDRPTGGAASSITAGANTYKWRVTAVAEETYEESLTGYGPSSTITGITQANPAVVTYSGADNFINGDEIYISTVVGMTQVNGIKFLVANVNTGANTFELQTTAGVNVDSSAYTAYSSGGTAQLTYIRASSAAAPTTADPHIISWTAVSGAREYSVYREFNGVYGFVGIAGSTTFTDIGLDADTTDTPPNERDVFDGAGDYPSAVTYFQQRLMFANTDNNPETVYASRTAQFTNFTTSNPIQDDDAVTFTMTGRQVNQVRYLIDIGNLIVFTTGGEWAIGGDVSGILKPGEVNPKQYSYNGSAAGLPPIVIGNTALYVQARGSIIRDLGYNYESEGYQGNDLTINSAHMFDNYSLTDWAFQQTPHSILWVVRDDGILMGLTYVREQQMLAWTRHEFDDATCENVCVVPEDNEDVLYVVVNRTVGGATKRYVERLSSRRIVDVIDTKILDSHLSYDGTNTTAVTMTLSSAGGWTHGHTITCTASSAFFTSADVGNEIHFTGADGLPLRFEIEGYTSTTVVTGRPNRDVPSGLRTTATAVWTKAVDEVTGLWHIEGKTVSVFADRFVAANPNNPAYTVVTVTNGTASLDKAYGIIHVGLPITADLETLNIDTPQGETIADKNKLVSKVTIFVEDSRGAWIGQEEPDEDADTILDGLMETKLRYDEGYNDPIALTTGTMEVNINSKWDNNGRIFIRQTDPIPLSVLAIAPAGLFPFRGG